MTESRTAMARAHLRRVERAAMRLETARAERDAAIRAAYSSGETLRDIAAVAKIGHQRVYQIVKEG